MVRCWLKENWLVMSTIAMVVAWGWGLAADVERKVDKDTYERRFYSLVEDIAEIKVDVSYIRGKLDATNTTDQVRSQDVRTVPADSLSYSNSCFVVGPYGDRPGGDITE
jgi:hypothetical protein